MQAALYGGSMDSALGTHAVCQWVDHTQRRRAHLLVCRQTPCILHARLPVQVVRGMLFLASSAVSISTGSSSAGLHDAFAETAEECKLSRHLMLLLFGLMGRQVKADDAA